MRWHGYVPNDEAMLITDGALAGLSLLQDDPNFRHSMPTKVAEYMARGVPVVTTPLPLAVDLVRAARVRVRGAVRRIPGAAAEAVLALQQDLGLRDAMGARGHQGASRVPALAGGRPGVRRPAGAVGWGGAVPRPVGWGHAGQVPSRGEAASPVSAQDRR